MHEVLPDQEAVDRLGLGLTLEAATVVYLVLSRALADGVAKKSEKLYRSLKLIGLSLSLETPTDAGTLVPRIALPGGSVLPTGGTAMARLGISRTDIRAEGGVVTGLQTRVLPIDWVLAFAPPLAWSWVAAAIAAGPAEMELRLSAAVNERMAEGIVVKTLSSELGMLTNVYGHVVKLRRQLNGGGLVPQVAAAAQLLRDWTSAPQAPSDVELAAAGASTKTRDTSAVPRRLVVEALRECEVATEWGRYSPADWPCGFRWLEMKRLVMLVLLMLGLRIGNINGLEVSDFEPQHQWEDSTTGPALRCRGEIMKGKTAADVSWKPLPSVVADIFTAWINCSGRAVGQPAAPFLISRKVKALGDSGEPYSSRAIERFVAGDRPRVVGETVKGGNRPLVPLPKNKWEGYQPHRFRSTVKQEVQRLLFAWSLQNPTDGRVGVPHEHVAELVIDHRVPDLGYADYYKGMRPTSLVGHAYELLFDNFWGEGAKEKRLDPDEIVAAREHVGVIKAELASLTVEYREAKTRYLQLENRNDALRVFEIQERRYDLREQLPECEKRLELALTKLTPVDWDVDLVDLDRRIELALEGNAEGPVPDEAPMADELTVADVAKLFACTTMTIRRWRNGDGLPTPAPFDPKHWRMVNKKDWRLPVAALNVNALPAPERERAGVLKAVRSERAKLGFARATSAQSILVSPPIDLLG